MWIVRAQAHSPCRTFYRNVRLTEVNLDPTAEVPNPGQVRIEDESLLNERVSFMDISSNVGERKPSAAESNCVFLTEFCRSSCESNSLGSLLQTIRHPTISFALTEAPGRHVISCRKTRIEVDGAGKMR